MLRSAPFLRRGALLIRGPHAAVHGSRLCGATLARVAPRPGHDAAATYFLRDNGKPGTLRARA